MLVSLRHNPFIIFSAKTPLRALYGRSGAFQCSFSPLILAFSDCSRDAGGYLLPVSGDLNGILIHHCVLARRSLTWIWHQSALRWAGKRSVASPTAPFGIKGSGALLCIKILVFIIFVVKILPEKRPFPVGNGLLLVVFILFFLINRRSNLILPSTFAQQ